MKNILLSKHDGSLENPYHFWIGYLLPIINEIDSNKNSNDTFLIHECGKMTHWLKTLSDYYKNIDIVRIENIFQLYLNNNKNKIFNNYDNPLNFNKDFLLKSTTLAKNIFIDKKYNDKTPIGILDRRPLEEYDGNEKNKTTRLINNIDQLKNMTKQNSKVINTSNYDPVKSASEYSQLSVLVGQWGAGLTNMIWMKPGSTIIQISAPQKIYPELWENSFKLLAECLGHNFINIVAQDNWSSDADLEKIVKIINEIEL